MRDKGAGKGDLALNNASNAQKSMGRGKIEHEIVVFGPGIHIPTANSIAANRIDQAIKHGVQSVACKNSMTHFKGAKADLDPNISDVPGSVIELMPLQKAGDLRCAPEAAELAPGRLDTAWRPVGAGPARVWPANLQP